MLFDQTTTNTREDWSLRLVRAWRHAKVRKFDDDDTNDDDDDDDDVDGDDDDDDDDDDV